MGGGEYLKKERKEKKAEKFAGKRGRVEDLEMLASRTERGRLLGNCS